ncbi:hypothetical protein [Streptomyces albipurpureus]|uniref:Uncharacterized protein n=1 Tax=Streptomyces albipurpureus TaxID=2897419 RepID=A0ABT0UKF5_9ACTN|nr:hypothetical protein [Streptomyces sp. CWNU-1]MCM2388580.1 hypothetical protein [Streptomyces sp. CWNU-1]
MSTHRPVVVLTELADPTADWVITELNERRVPVVRLDSSNLPGLVVRMLEDLDPKDGARVLEIGTRVEGGPWLVHAIDIGDGSLATLVPNDDSGYGFRVRQGGPHRLWDDVEAAIDAWKAAGSPPQTAFTLTVTPTEQRVRLDTPDGPSWTLPT